MLCFRSHEIKLLARDNRRMRTTLSVAYGNYHTKKDINNTLHLKNLLDARGDYRQLVSAEMTMCRDLDLKVCFCINLILKHESSCMVTR